MIFKIFNFTKIFIFIIFLFFSVNSFSKDVEDDFSYNVTACMQSDYLFWHGKKYDELRYGGYLRSADLFVDGSIICNHLDYFIHFNLNDYSYENCFSQAYLTFFYDFLKVRIGQMLLPFGLEQASPVYDKFFLETSLLNGMGDGKYLGMSVIFNFKHFSFFSYIAVPELKYLLEQKYNFRYLMSFRTFLNFFTKDNIVFHIGADYRRIKEDQKGLKPFQDIFYRDNPALKTYSSLLNAYNGIIVTSNIYDLEFAIMWKSLFFQAEVGFVDVGWKDFDREIYSTVCFQFSYFLRGGCHTYNNYEGYFGNPNVFYSKGVLELLFKYCIVDMLNYGSLLTGFSQIDGKKESILFGMNWFINESVKMQVNCVVDDYVYRKSPGIQIAGIGFRIQLEY